MKKVLIITIGVLMVVGIYAQPPGGGGMGPGGGGPGGPPPGGGMPNRSSSSENNLVLERFPEIPDLTLKQREKMGNILTKEHKDIEKQIEKKHDVEKGFAPNLSENDFKKQKQKIDEIDGKIRDIRSKSNNKIKKELSEDQYIAFLEKREEFRFRRPPQQQGMRPRQNDDDNDDRPPLPPQDDDFF